ncbi:MAG: hypothetical protein ACO3JG_15795, partial [Luteolibacter sp.]
MSDFPLACSAGFRPARKWHWHAGGGLLLFVILPTPGLAAQPDVLESLVVTGEATRAATVPLFGNPLRREAAELQALPCATRGTYQDLLAAAAGGYADNPSGGTFSLRGLNQDGLFYSVGTASNPLITVLEDGAPLSTATLRYLPPALWGLESAELRRGPQFLQPGPNALGGSLALQSTPAGFSRYGNASLEAAEHGTSRGGLAQDFTLCPGELALRFSAYHHESDGEVTNLHDGNGEFAATRRCRYQARVLWQPGKSRDAQVDLTLVHDESRGNPFGTARAVSGYDL